MGRQPLPLIDVTSLFLAGPLGVDPLLPFLTGGDVETRPATATGLRLLEGQTGGLPGLERRPGASIGGVLADVPRAYWVPRAALLGVVPSEVTLESGGTATGIFATKSTGRSYSIGDWVSRFAPIFDEALDELGQSVEMRGNSEPSLHMILARAAARLAGGERTNCGADDAKTRDEVRLVHRTHVHKGFFAYDLMTLHHPLFRGGQGPEISREVFLGCEAALVLPYDPVRDQVLLVEQFRSGPYAGGDPFPWTLEPVAGLVDPGETPGTTALRESGEEAGLTLSHLEKVGGAYPSPGTSTEFYHLFVGIADFGSIDEGGGLADEGEDIRVHTIDFPEFSEKAHTGKLNVLPLMTLALWLDINRDRIRKGGVQGIATP